MSATPTGRPRVSDATVAAVTAAAAAVKDAGDGWAHAVALDQPWEAQERAQILFYSQVDRLAGLLTGPTGQGHPPWE